jgi:hypothetical protein
MWCCGNMDAQRPARGVQVRWKLDSGRTRRGTGPPRPATRRGTAQCRSADAPRRWPAPERPEPCCPRALPTGSARLAAPPLAANRLGPAGRNLSRQARPAGRTGSKLGRGPSKALVERAVFSESPEWLDGGKRCEGHAGGSSPCSIPSACCSARLFDIPTRSARPASDSFSASQMRPASCF